MAKKTNNFKNGKNAGKRCKDDYKSTGKSRYDKAKGLDNDVSTVEETKGGYALKSEGNDIGWYTKYPELYADATKLNWNHILGAGYKLDKPAQYWSNPVETEVTYAHTPGVTSVGYYCTLGQNNDDNDPVNRTMSALYAQILSHTTGNLDMQQADLAMYILWGTDIAANIMTAMRALNYSYQWTADNWYNPKATLIAMGFDPATIINHQNAIRQRINNAIFRFNQLNIVGGFDYQNRVFQISSGIYKDEDSTRANLFLFKKMNYYDIAIGDNGEYLKSYRFSEENQGDYYNLDINVILDVIEVQLTAISASTWRGIVQSSIERAFTEAQYYKLMPVTENDTVSAVYDEHMKVEFMNMNFVPVDPDSLDIQVSQPEGFVSTNPCVTYSALLNNLTAIAAVNNAVKANMLINIDHENPSSEDAMIATRLMTMSDRFEGGKQYWNICGTEICHTMTVWTLDSRTNQLKGGRVNFGHMVFDENTTPEDYAVAFATLVALTKYDKHPFVQIGTLVDQTYTALGFIGETYRYALVDRDAAYSMNNAATLSLFAPIITNWKR